MEITKVKISDTIGAAILWVIIALAFILCIYLAKDVAGITLSDSTLIISFLGALATFVVVGNLTQVSAIRQEMLDEQKNIKKDLLNSITETEAKNIIDARAKEVLDIMTKHTTEEFDLLAELSHYCLFDFLHDIRYNQDKRYTIDDERKGHQTDVKVRIERNTVIFYKNEGDNETIYENVTKCAGKRFSYEVINHALVTLSPKTLEISASKSNEDHNDIND